MSIKEIINELENAKQFALVGHKEAIAEAITLLKTHPDNQPNEPLEVGVDVLRALTVAANSLRYNPEIDQDEAAAYELLLVNLRDEFCHKKQEPLTLEELRGMAGQPVWIKKGLEISEWAIVLGREDLFCLHFTVLRGQIRLVPKEYGTVWFAYRRPPEEFM